MFPATMLQGGGGILRLAKISPGEEIDYGRMADSDSIHPALNGEAGNTGLFPRAHLRRSGAMAIRPALRARYSRNWPEISARVRFARAGGLCQNCKRPHLATIRCL